MEKTCWCLDVKRRLLCLKNYEIAEYFKCSDEGVRKACKRLSITRKKKTKLYRERDEEKRREYLDEIKDISP